MPVTYESIATTTLTTSAADVTFSNISGTYTDLVLVMTPKISSGTAQVLCRVNNDTGTNYSFTRMGGTGTASGSDRATNTDFMQATWYGYPGATNNQTTISNFMNYSNTTTHKTMITRPNNADTGVGINVNVWRSTSAITSIKIYPDASTFASGSIFTLFGIKAA